MPESRPIADQITAAFGGEFTLDDHAGSVPWPPVFRHALSGQRFRYIPGGQFQMGLSEQEEAAAKAIFDPMPANLDEMRPVRLIKTEPFLMAERPVLTREMGDELSEHPNAVAYVGYDEAVDYAQRYGMTLPTESQWEYACRAGSSTLFTFGDRLPDEQELADWLTFDFSAGSGRANAFGLYGLFVGEWCTELFDVHEAVRVVRGGGAYFWPWQDQEWVWCMSAMRIPATDLPEGECGFRLVRNLPHGL